MQKLFTTQNEGGHHLQMAASKLREKLSCFFNQ